MSMFPMPHDALPGMKSLNEMDAQLKSMLPGEMASAVNLMAHPLAGAAAASALGLGLASHAFGVWMGSVAAAAEASQRLFTAVLDDVPDVESFRDKVEAPAVRARAAARTLMADAAAAARDVVEEVRGAEAKKSGDVVDPVTTRAEPVAQQAPAQAAALMPEDFRQPRALDKPATPDDLKSIAGIGPKLEQVLNGLGVWTFAQIAGWSREEVAWMDDTLGFKGRIGRDDWLGQAARMSAAREG